MRTTLTLAICILTLTTIVAADTSADECREYVSTCPQLVFAGEAGLASAIAVAGNTAYLGLNGGVKVYDVSDLTHPVELGTVAVPGSVFDLRLAGGYLYIAERDVGLAVATAPPGGLPAIVAEVPLPDGAWGLEVAGSLAYVAAGTAGLVILDVADPVQPQVLSTVAIAPAIYWLALGEGLVYGALGDGIQVVDVSDPAAPVLGDLVSTDDSVVCLARLGGVLFAGLFDGRLISYSLAMPSSPDLQDEVQLPDFATAMVGQGQDLWVCGAETGLMRIDASDPAQLARGDFVEDAGIFSGFQITGDLALTAGSEGGLRVYDLSLVIPDYNAGWYRAPNGVTDVAAAGTRAYAADYFAGLVTLDITDPERLTPIDTCPLSGEIDRIILSGDHAFVGARWDGIRVLDLADPDHPVHLATIELGGLVSDFELMGDWLLATVSTYGGYRVLAVLDVSNWRSPGVVATVQVHVEPSQVAVSGSVAVVASSYGWLDFVDLAHPAAPLVVGSLRVMSNPVGLVMTGDIVHVCNYEGEVRVIDAANPAAPLQVAALQTGMYLTEAFVADDRLYLAAGLDGVLVLDVADPAAPAVVGQAYTAGYTDNLTVSGSYVFATETYFGVVVVPVPCRPDVSVAPGAAPKTSLAAAPNPFNPQTIVSFDLPAATTGSVAIHDVRGRLVRQLLPATALAAGSHALTWNGRDDGGRDLPAGVYFARLESGRDPAVVKLTLLK